MTSVGTFAKPLGQILGSVRPSPGVVDLALGDAVIALERSCGHLP